MRSWMAPTGQSAPPGPALLNGVPLDQASENGIQTPPLVPFTYLPSVQIMVAREAGGHAAGLVLAAKGGHNGEHHNHRDVGSVVVAVDGVPLLVDAGQPTYTAKTFGPDRYDIRAMQSAWHSVPAPFGLEQGTGKAFAADVLRTPSPEDPTLELALGAAYGLHPEQWVRTSSLDREARQVVVADRWNLATSPETGERNADPLSRATPDVDITYLAAGTVRLGWTVPQQSSAPVFRPQAFRPWELPRRELRRRPHSLPGRPGAAPALGAGRRRRTRRRMAPRRSAAGRSLGRKADAPALPPARRTQRRRHIYPDSGGNIMSPEQPLEGAGKSLFSLQRRERLMEELRAHGAITVRAIAAKLGVSELTIRRDVNILADEGLVSRVHGGATLPSRLDRSATGARPQQHSYSIGMVVPSLDYYWPQVISGARAEAEEQNLRILVRGSAYDAADNRRQVQALLDTQNIDGLIVAPDLTGEEGQELLRWLNALPIPVVLAERRSPGENPAHRLEWVATDHAFGAGMAVRHLWQEGHRQIGCLTDSSSPTSPHVVRGWRQALAALKIPAGWRRPRGFGQTGQRRPGRTLRPRPGTVQERQGPRPCWSTRTPRRWRSCSTAWTGGSRCRATWRSWATTTKWPTLPSPPSRPCGRPSSTWARWPSSSWRPASPRAGCGRCTGSN